MAEKKKTASKNNGGKKPVQNNGRKKPAQPQRTEKKKNPQRRALLYFVIAALLLCLILIRGQNIWSSLRGFVFGIFGFSSVLLPILFGYFTYLTARGSQIYHRSAKLWLAVGILLSIDILFFLFDGRAFENVGYFDTLKSLYLTSYSASGPLSCNGGIISGLLGYPLMNGCGRSAAIAVTMVALVAFVLLITGISIADVLRVAQKPVTAVAHRISRAKQNRVTDDGVDELYKRYAKKNSGRDKKKKRGERIDIKLDEPAEKVNNDCEIIPDEEEGSAVEMDAEKQLDHALKMNGAETDGTLPDNPASAMADVLNREKKQDGLSPENIPVQRYKPPVEVVDDIPEEEEFTVPKEEKNLDQILNEPKYKFPPIDILRLPSNTDDAGAMNELQGNATKLINTLKSFGVGASITNICRGPSVTRYELKPAPGVKISKITNLTDDIALNLAAEGVRIEAPIPGKDAVGIEVPNKMITTVSMRELIDSDDFRNGKSRLTCVLGKDISGNIVSTDLAAMPHLLIAGTTGSGKSVCVNSILLSILYKATPDEVKLLLIDPKMVEFSKYKGIPHLLVPVVSDAKKAAGALNWAVSEMLQRYKLFSEYDCKNIHGFNQLVEENQSYIRKHSDEDPDACMELNGLPVPKEKMSQIVIAIDELADLMMAAPNEVEESICRLAQMARAAGMHLVIATQRPSVNVITGVIKANIPSRIALKVSSQIDSRTILDFGGAEKLIGRGDMLFAPVGSPKPQRVQGCYASDEEIENVTAFIKKSYKAEYNAEVEEKIRKIAAEDINSGKHGKNNDVSEADADSELDSKMEEAIRCVIEAGQASTSMLQRKIKVGYARAGRMIDDMEQMGIVGPYQGSKPRDVLMTYNEWLERRNILGDNSDEE